jgi:hypothetical protein
MSIGVSVRTTKFAGRNPDGRGDTWGHCTSEYSCERLLVRLLKTLSMRITIILISILFVLDINLSGQTRIIHGRVISEDFDGLTKVRIQNIDTILIGETDIEGRFTIEIPLQDSEKLHLSWIGMEWTTIELNKNCDTVEVVMMYDVIYDFMTANKIDRLRLKRFKKLPELHELAYEKGIFLTKEQCYEQDFVAIKPRLDEIKKNSINE